LHQWTRMPHAIVATHGELSFAKPLGITRDTPECNSLA